MIEGGRVAGGQGCRGSEDAGLLTPDAESWVMAGPGGKGAVRAYELNWQFGLDHRHCWRIGGREFLFVASVLL